MRRPKTIRLETLQAEIAICLAAIPSSTFDLRAQGQREAFTHLGTYLANYAALRYRKAATYDDPETTPATLTDPAKRTPGNRRRKSAGAATRARVTHGARGAGARGTRQARRRSRGLHVRETSPGVDAGARAIGMGSK